MALGVDDYETSLVPFAPAVDTIPTSTFDRKDSAPNNTVKPTRKPGRTPGRTSFATWRAGRMPRQPLQTVRPLQRDGSLLDWHVLAIASLATRLTYDTFGETIGLNNVVENIYCLKTVGRGASFTVKAHDETRFGQKDRKRLEDIGITGIVLKRLRHQHNSPADDANRLAAILFELRVLTHKPLHDHENIVTFVGLIWEGDPLGRDLLWPILIMERAHHGSLAQFQQRRFTLRYETKRNLCADVAAGLDALHGCGIVHGDVKNENILVFEHPTRGYIAKLADFGCAVLDQQELDERTAALGGTPPWTAPEFRDSRLTRASMEATDVYSYGFLVWRVMIDGADPFKCFEFGDEGKLATIETWKRDDEMVEKAVWSLMCHPESDVQTEDVCSIFEVTLQMIAAKRDLRGALQILNREVSVLRARDGGQSTQSLEKIEVQMEKMLVDTFKLKDFEYSFQRQYVRALQYSLRQYKRNSNFSEMAKCALLRCFLTGVGGKPDIDAALEVLWDICTHDKEVVLRHAEMILLSVRLCEAHGKPIPDHLPVNDWLWCNAIFGSRHAHNVLAARDPDEAASALKSSRSKIHGASYDDCKTIQQLVRSTTFLIDSLDPASRFSGSFVFPSTENGDSVLHCAAMAGELETVEALVIRIGADVNELNSMHESPLLQACRAGHFEVACFLLSRGADPTVQSAAYGETCLHFLSSFQEEWQMEYIAHECLERGASLTIHASGFENGMFSYEAPESGSPLHWAVGNANLVAVKILCESGADVYQDSMNARGLLRTPIEVATSRLYVDILRYFLHDCGVIEKARTCIETKSLIDSLARSVASNSLSDPITNRLLHGGKHSEVFSQAVSLLAEASVSFDGSGAGEMLYCAFKTGDCDRLECLLRHGSPVDALFGEQETLLQQCIITCDKGMFDLTLQYGANVSLRIAGGNYLHLCVTRHHHDTYFAEELLKRGIPVDDENDVGCTPFRNAVKRGCFQLATLFLKYGADKEGLHDGLTVLGDLAMAGPDYPLDAFKYLLEPPHEYGAASFVVCPGIEGSVLQVLATKAEEGRDSSGFMPYLAYLLERFPSPKHLDCDATGTTALHISVQACFAESVQLLLEAGADPNILSCRHRTALDMALDKAEESDPTLPGFPEEVYGAGDKAVALYIARRWRVVELLLSFGAMRSEDLPTAGLHAAQVLNIELQPLLDKRGHMSYAEALPTLEEWISSLTELISSHLQEIIVESPSLDRSLDDFTRVICEALRPYYAQISIERDDEGVEPVYLGMGVEDAEEVEMELIQLLGKK